MVLVRSFVVCLLAAPFATTACSSDKGGTGETPTPGGPEDVADGGTALPEAATGDGAPIATADAGEVAPDATPVHLPCPVGLGARWVCEAALRQRCVDGALLTEACDFSCTDGAGGGDATCACGANAGFSHWNCLADGALHACVGGIYERRACGAAGCTAGPQGTNDTCNLQAPSLGAVVARLGTECGTFSPGTICGITVRDLVTGETAGARGDTPFVSASSAKAVWVAAALFDVGVGPVTPHADPIFRSSDNDEAGAVIDLLVSPARVNTFMWGDLGLATSGFCAWGFGHPRNATNCQQTMGGDNFFTSNDMVSFLTALWDRSLLGATASAAELQWMTLSPRSGYGGWLGTQIPAAARATMHHKAGWLPPSDVPGYTNANDIGIIEPPGGHPYAVALLFDGGTSFDAKQLPTLEYASCAIYHAVAKDVGDPFAGCSHP